MKYYGIYTQLLTVKSKFLKIEVVMIYQAFAENSPEESYFYFRFLSLLIFQKPRQLVVSNFTK